MFRRQVSKRVLLLEFGSQSLTIAQVKYGVDTVDFSHIRRVSLPDGATERGVPTEPAKMAGLIKQLCKEEHLYARRAAVVLPAEAAFSTLIALPAHLSLEEARAFARDPASGLQIPIPLQQTDFDLVPCGAPPRLVEGQPHHTYFLTSVPQKLVDQLLLTLHKADLEVLSVDLAFASQLRLMAADVASLGVCEYLLILELVRDCCHLAIVSSSGPVALERLAAIREFPAPSFDAAKTQAAIEEGLSAESITLADDSYMQISELDLRVLLLELRQSMAQFSSAQPHCHWRGLAITGANSAHPGLAELLSSELDVQAHVVRPLGATGVGSVGMASLLVHQSLNRLIGLGLGVLPHDALVACSLADTAHHHALTDLDSPGSDSASLFEITPDSTLPVEEVNSPAIEQGKGGLAPLRTGGVEHGEHQEWPSTRVVVEEFVHKEEAVLPPDVKEMEEPCLQVEDSEASTDSFDQLLSVPNGAVSVSQHELDTDEALAGLGELRFGGEEPEKQQEWPSIHSQLAEPVRLESLGPTSEDEVWLDLHVDASDATEDAGGELLSFAVGDETQSEHEPGSDGMSGGLGELRFGDQDLEEEQWPSIRSVAIDPEPDVAVEFSTVDEEEEWPSIKRSDAGPSATDQSHTSNVPTLHALGSDAYQAMTVKQLKQICRNRRLSGYSNLNKSDLIALLES